MLIKHTNKKLLIITLEQIIIRFKIKHKMNIFELIRFILDLTICIIILSFLILLINEYYISITQFIYKIYIFIYKSYIIFKDHKSIRELFNNERLYISIKNTNKLNGSDLFEAILIEFLNRSEIADSLNSRVIEIYAYTVEGNPLTISTNIQLDRLSTIDDFYHQILFDYLEGGNYKLDDLDNIDTLYIHMISS